MGASTNLAEGSEAEEWTREATNREVVGSIVEQSTKRRVDNVGAVGRADTNIFSNTDLTCCGSGKTVMTVSCGTLYQLVPCNACKWFKDKTARIRGLALILF